jgi:excisionase family DNA binding protein
MVTTAGPLLDVHQAAVRLGCNPETVRRWIREGRLKAHREKGRWRMFPEEIDHVGARGETKMTLKEWADWVLSDPPRGLKESTGSTAKDAIIQDREDRERELEARVRHLRGS